jgi:hypothetical protein
MEAEMKNQRLKTPHRAFRAFSGAYPRGQVLNAGSTAIHGGAAAMNREHPRLTRRIFWLKSRNLPGPVPNVFPYLAEVDWCETRNG